MLLPISALSHLLVDALCAATLFGRLAGAEQPGAFFLLYNTLAFSTQCFVGFAADRLRRHGTGAALSLLLVVLGWALPLPGVLRVVFVGLGNSVFHVSCGAMTLEKSRGKAGALGVFVAPGAVGVTLGTLWPRLGGVFAVLSVLCAAAFLLLRPKAEDPTAERYETQTGPGFAVPLLLTLAVAVRAIGGTAVSFPWKTGIFTALAATAAVFAGKTAGGFVLDRLGPRKTALFSILPAAVLIAFCSRWAVPSLLGQFALNLTMPVTLWLLYRSMPDAPGFAFGLAASALWPGTLAGQLMTLTGPALWACVTVSFLFGLWAVLFACRKLSFYNKERSV